MCSSANDSNTGAKPHPAVLRLVREPERRSHDDRLAAELDPNHATGIDHPALLTLQRRQPFAHVLASDEAAHPVRVGLPAPTPSRSPEQAPVRVAVRLKCDEDSRAACRSLDSTAPEETSTVTT
jgi:hypothetical protein